jgi:hypothetical protein
MVGDNPNAGIDPEVIAPLSKLKGLGGEVMVRGQISGADIILSSDKTGDRNQRYF